MIASLILASVLLAPAASPPELPSEPEPIAVPVPVEAPGEAPAQPAVEAAPAESTPVTIPNPEDVRDAAEAGQGALPPPGPTASTPHSSAPPNPRARPSEGVFAVGSSGVAPLPPPPPPVPVDAIARGRWSGTGWLSVRVLVSGPLAGSPPARPTVISLGGGVEGGWRIRQWIGLGASFTRQPHEVYREDVPDAPAIVDYRGYLTIWDLAYLRVFAPVRGRVDPFIDIGGGLAFFDPARDRPNLLGGSVRASVGFEAWVARNLTLGMTGIYRMNLVDGTIGHAWQAAVDFGIHW